MSHAHGEVYQGGRIVGYYEYDGTADIACSRIQESPEAVNASWRGDNWRECECGQDAEDVILYSDYGDGFHWPAKACLRCHAITDGQMPYAEDWAPGPEWCKDGRPITEPPGIEDR
jgi:hypothetical protein